VIDIPLLGGWFPLALTVVCAALVVLVVARRDRRWLTRGLPVCVLLGALAGWGVSWLVADQGMAAEAPPRMLLVWVAVAAGGIVAVPLTWRGARWWRRATALVLVPAAVLAAAVSVNSWTGYFRSVDDVWQVASGEDTPGTVGVDGLAAMRGTVQPRGIVVSVDVPSTRSGFTHRTEYVYLPPAWFVGATPPALPVVEMIGGAFATPQDWIRTGDADRTADAFAAAHGGTAPVLVLADAGGGFDSDTECVDGRRGNSATHLEDELPEYVAHTVGTSADPAHWAVVGWSMGGTCAVQMTARRPDRFHTFVSISGDTGPNIGSPDNTLAELYGGDRARMAAFDPATQLAAHAPFSGVQGVFEEGADGHSAADYLAGPTGLPVGIEKVGTADVLAPRAAAAGIPSLVIRRDLQHTWQFAYEAFREILPWVAGRVGTPGAAELPLATAVGGRPVAGA